MAQWSLQLQGVPTHVPTYRTHTAPDPIHAGLCHDLYYPLLEACSLCLPSQLRLATADVVYLDALQ